jgi:hypothetical protein
MWESTVFLKESVKNEDPKLKFFGELIHELNRKLSSIKA